MNDIKPDFLKLQKLLDGKLFRIPSYQRAYSWESAQREDLFNDIRKISQNQQTNHFMATIVCLKLKNETAIIGAEEFQVYEIVDGQQRLTTLVALLKCISMKLKNKEEQTKLDKFLVKGDERLILLQTNHESSEMFMNFLKNGKITKSNLQTLAEKNLSNLFTDCNQFISDWTEEFGKDILSLLFIINNRLTFIFHQLDDKASVFTIFEVLNSRGLDVNWLDKAKSILMGFAYEKYDKSTTSDEHIATLQNSWSKIYRLLGIKEIPGDEILTYCITLMNTEKEIGRLISTKDAISYIKTKCQEDSNFIFKFTSMLVEITENLKNLYDNRKLRTVASITQSRLLAISISINRNLNDNDKKEALEHWEKITFRIFGMMDKDAKKKVGDYIRLAREIYANDILFKYEEEIDDNSLKKENDKFSKLSFKDKIIYRIKLIGYDSPIEDALEYLRNADCYNRWEEEARYFFYKYEEFILKQIKGRMNGEAWDEIWKESPLKSIEHICPKNYPPTPEWKDMLGSGKQSFEKNVHRLGNLIMLTPSLNSQCGTKSIKEKKSIYKKALLHHVNDLLYEDYINNSDSKEKFKKWDKKAIDQREEKLLEIAAKIWG